MEEKYSIIRIEKLKLNEVTPICNHHERLKDKYKSNPDIDTERSHLNFHIVTPTDKYRPLVLARIEEAGAKRRKDSVVLQDCIVAATPEWIMAMDEDAQAEYFRYAFEFFEKRYRRENIISAVVHLDEKTPHMHLVFVPITEDGRLSSKEIIGGPKGMHRLQDDFYEHMELKYPELDRGKPKQVTHRKHIPTYLFKQTAKSFVHYNEIVDAIKTINMFNSGPQKEAAIELLALYVPQMAQLNDQVKMTDKYIAELEKQNAELEETVESKNRTIRGKNSVIEDKDDEIRELKWAADDKVRELNKQLKELLSLFKMISPEEQARVIALQQRKKAERER